MTNQSDARTELDLDAIERRANDIIPDKGDDFFDDLHRSLSADVLALVAECRRASAERGRLVNTTRHRDVTLETYETPNESEGGE